MGRSPWLRVYSNKLSRPFRTRFRFASGRFDGLRLACPNNSPDHYAKGTPSLPLREARTAVYATDFRFYFTRLPPFFSPFHHRTGALSGFDVYLGLEGGPPGFLPGSTCPVVLGYLLHSTSV